MGKRARKLPQRYEPEEIRTVRRKTVDVSNDEPRPSKTRKTDKEEDDEAFEEPESDAEEDDYAKEASPQKRGRKKRKRGRPMSGTQKYNRGPEEDRSCPHCLKVIVSKAGLKYHLDHLVCRKEKKPPAARKPKKPKATNASTPVSEITCTIVSAPKRVRGKSNPLSKRRFRGSEEDRICPSCKKVFTSALGCQYHISKKVCKVRASTELANTLAYPTLQPGSKFVTNFGIVEVVSDERAVSKYKYPANIHDEAKSFAGYKDKRQNARSKMTLTYAFLSRLRRYRMMRNYGLNNINSESTRKSYTSSAAKSIEGRPTERIMPNANEPREDPLSPPEAFPDRIVTCKLIPDARTRVFNATDQDPHSPRVNTVGFASMLYLRRRDLNKSYSPESKIYVCTECGGDYSSREGYTYHCRSEVCQKKSKARGKAREESLQSVQARLNRHLKRHSTRRKKQRKRWDTPVYPGAWLSLGFKTTMFLKPVSTLVIEKGDEAKVEQRIATADQTLQDLREQVRQNTVKLNDRKHGAMYASVFTSLGFKRPKPPQKPRRQRKKRSRKPEREEEGDSSSDEYSPPIEENPEIVDAQVLIDEARSGRYPSIQRYGGEHGDSCVICKDGGTLLCCDFCSNVVHFKCMLTKVRINDAPGQGQDFLCHSCARKILSRRRRAEKRRLMKHQEALDKARQKAVDDIPDSVDESEKKNYESDYHAAAAVGRELSELMELLEDAKSRVYQMNEVAKLNKLRRLQIE